MRVVNLASKRLPTSWGYPVPRSKEKRLGHLSKRGEQARSKQKYKKKGGEGGQDTKSLSLLPDHGPQPGIKAASC